MIALNVFVNEFFKVLQESRSSVLVRGLLSALTLSQVLVQTGWPDDHQLHEDERFDFIVVGAGSAGAVIAARLSEVPYWRVLLLEAGGDPPPTSTIPSLFATLGGTEYDWNYKAYFDNGTGNAHVGNTLPYTRGKVLGGSSSVNYLVYSRGVPEDYNDWEIVAPGWSWADVLPYFKKLENMTDHSVFSIPQNAELHSMEGPVGVSRPEDNFFAAEINNQMLKSFKQIGIPTVLESNGPNIVGATRPHFTFADGRRTSTAEAYLRFTKDKTNLYVAKYSRATKVLIDPNTLEAYGVEVLQKGNKVKIYADREVVISAGTIDSPKILMLSGIGPQQELEKVGILPIVDLPVGLNMQDHPFVPLSFVGKKGLQSALSNLLVPTQLNEFPVPFQSGFFTVFKDLEYPDERPQYQFFNIFIGATAAPLVRFGCGIYGYRSEFCDSLAKNNIFREITQMSLILMHPSSRGQVKLKSNNPLDDPIIELGYFRDSVDLLYLREAVKYMRRLEKTTYFEENDGFLAKLDVAGCEGLAYGSNDYWDCYVLNTVGSMLHASGTCRMGDDGVVNERLQVHGIRRLRVADASIMPEIPSGNTNAPVMMIGEKAADMIKEDHRIKEYHRYFREISYF